MEYISEYIERRFQGFDAGERPSELRGSDTPQLSRGVQIDMFSELAAILYVDEVLDGEGRFLYLDSKSSVSALTEDGSGLRP